MASTSVIQLAQTVITTTPTTYYTAPSDGTAIAQEIILCNTTPGPVTITMNFVLANSQSSAANTILYNYEVPPGQTVFLSQSTALPSQAAIVVAASAPDAVGMTISGVEVQ